tara:strand:+ start:292 stop:528 length:237 start_codon:yes stop_codon:yes gene_type:complete
MDYEFVPVKDHKHLLRDPQTNSIVNTNQSEYEEYIARRDAARKVKEESSSMEQDLANLKGEMNEIKSLLKDLVSKTTT